MNIDASQGENSVDLATMKLATMNNSGQQILFPVTVHKTVASYIKKKKEIEPSTPNSIMNGIIHEPGVSPNGVKS